MVNSLQPRKETNVRRKSLGYIFRHAAFFFKERKILTKNTCGYAQKKIQNEINEMQR